MDGHEMYFGDSVVGKASKIGIEISSTSPLIFTVIKKCEIWRRFQHHSTLSRSRLKMQQDPNAETNFLCRNDRPVFSPSLVKLGLRTSKNRWAEMPTAKIIRRKRTKSPIT